MVMNLKDHNDLTWEVNLSVNMVEILEDEADEDSDEDLVVVSVEMLDEIEEDLLQGKDHSVEEMEIQNQVNLVLLTTILEVMHEEKQNDITNQQAIDLEVLIIDLDSDEEKDLEVDEVLLTDQLLELIDEKDLQVDIMIMVENQDDHSVLELDNTNKASKEYKHNQIIQNYSYNGSFFYSNSTPLKIDILLTQ